MKKYLFILIALFLLFGTGYSQSERMVLAEEFTSATCPPCGSQNPAFDALLQQNADKIISIKYHMNWPAPGNDPMYLHNTVDNNARRSYYGIQTIPQVQMEGNWWDGMPSQVTQYLINSAYNIGSPFDIKVHHELSPNADSIYISTLVQATDNVSSSDMRAFVVVIEKHIHFNSPPGTNGEKDFYNVMVKMLPTNTGYILPSSFSTGDYVFFSNSWKLENVYNNDELEVVVFIQDYSSKVVFQAGVSSTDPLAPLYTNDVGIKNVQYVTDKNCSGKMSPKIVIQNNGATDITSMDIQYYINGGDTATINWTGNLSFLDDAVIQLPDLNFPLQDTNHIVFEVPVINGGSDDYYANNISDKEFFRADMIGETAYMFLGLDDNPDQTTWKLFDYLGNVVQEGGPYSTPNSIETIPLIFPTSSCYRLEMYDSGNDGLTGNGFYQVVYGTNSTAFSGDNFFDKDVNEITYDIVGVDEQETIQGLRLYPNPASNNISVSFLLNESSPVDITLYDVLGMQVLNKNMGMSNEGKVDASFDVSGLQTGVYFVKISAGQKSYVKKVFVK